MNKYEKISLEGLLAMNREDSGNWCHEWESEVKKKAKETFFDMNYPELEEFYKQYSSDGIDPWFDAWDEAVLSRYPFEQILGRLDSLEKAMSVIMKAIGDNHNEGYRR